MNAETIARKARKSISRFCIEECRSYCCRKGYLVLTKKETELITQNQINKYEKQGALKKLNENAYSLCLSKLENGCPRLENFKCTIHQRKNRPAACKEFPLFIQGKKITLSQRCPAVRNNLFYPYIHQLIKIGYKVSPANAYSDFEINPALIKKTVKNP